MGGSAFSAGAAPLCTPRMPPHIYHAEKQRCMQLLRQLYVHVDSPIDGPGKTDFGDIDILVFERRSDAPLPPATEPNTKPSSELIREIAMLLGAEHAILETATSSNLAIPWPKSDDGKDANESAEKHIQVDVRLSPSLESHNWMLFKHAHGDIWNLVGSLIRPYGLTIDDTGMYIRVPEIESIYKARAKVHLTSDPFSTLRFLGLPFDGAHSRTWIDEPFRDQDAMFEYAALCCMMYIAPGTKASRDDATNHGEGHNLLKDVQNLKANDRKRMQHRPGFRRWIEEFVPKCRAEGRFSVQTTNRAKITDEALERFGVGEEFSRRRDEFLLERQRDFIWNGIIKTQIPALLPDQADQKAILARSCLVKALKRIILERDASFGVEFDERMMRNEGEDGFYNEDRVRDFIEEHKDEVQEAALSRHHNAFMEHLEKKKLKEAKA